MVISLRFLISDFNALDLLDMHIVKEFGVDGCEFYMTLGVGRDMVVNDRLAVLKKLDGQSYK